MFIWMCRSYLFKEAAVSCQKLLLAAPEPDTGIFQPRGRDILASIATMRLALVLWEVLLVIVSRYEQRK